MTYGIHASAKNQSYEKQGGYYLNKKSSLVMKEMIIDITTSSAFITLRQAAYLL